MKDHLGAVGKVDPRNLCSCVSACLLLFLGQWGPAVYLCYKVGLAKANTLVYEAGELPFSPSNPLALHVPLPWRLLALPWDSPSSFPWSLIYPPFGCPPLCPVCRAAGPLPRGGQ